jgi:hypothetical protein
LPKKKKRKEKKKFFGGKSYTKGDIITSYLEATSLPNT